MFLGIEIGGTKLQLGVGPGNAVIRRLRRETVDPSQGAAGIRRQILAATPALLREARVAKPRLRAAGIGFGGPVDDASQATIKSHQIAGWENFPIARWLSDELSVPVALGNDADVAGLAEASYGAGVGCSPVFYITIGSGIGGGLILDGRIHRGTGRGAAEIGHLRVAQPDGSFAPLEHIASGWGMERRARELGEHWTVRDLARVAPRRPEAGAILESALNGLAEAICHVIALVCPRRIVIGGGVSLLGERRLFQPLRRKVAERVFAPFAGLTDIVPAALGEEVVVHGALALARQHVH